MPNVRLRTIINQDNSTTFQVQFNEGGEWTDLTWDMISDKPFETLDDTVFMVDENGVLTITDIHTVTNWTDVEDKPFIFLDPDDFTVSASGVLSYTGSLDWSAIVGKPFNTLDNNDFEVQNGQLSVRHQTIPNQTWSQIQNKPFTSLDPTNFQVVGGVLYLNLNPEIPTWSNVQNKPFTYLDNSDFAVVGDTLKVKHQTIPDQNWSQIQQKPFETLDANDFTVDADGKMTVNFPAPPTPTPDDWDDVTNKPFETLNGTDFSVDADGEVTVNFPAPPTPTPDDWDDVTNKPFETLNSSDFSVDPDTGELSLAGGGGGGNPDWTDVQNKPFDTLDSPLLSVYNGGLRVYPHMWFKTEMSSSHKIDSDFYFKQFIFQYIANSYKKRFGLDNPFDGWYCPAMDDNKIYHIRNKIKIDTSAITGGSVLSGDYWLSMKLCGFRMFQTSSMDTYYVQVEVSGMPMILNGNAVVSTWRGIVLAYAWKTDGEYTSVNCNANGDSQMLTYSEATDIYAYCQ